MDVREKLVELVDKARRYAANKCHSFMSCAECDHYGEHDGNCRNTYIAESLIADGVIVQEMKPGDKVWYVSNVVGEVCEATITRVEYNYFTEPQEWLEVSFVSSMFGKISERNRIDLILNKRVFLTKEEAEAHLPQPPKGE